MEMEIIGVMDLQLLGQVQRLEHYLFTALQDGLQVVF
jgi:hypothetical protein